MGEVGLADFHDLAASVPAEVQALIKQAENGLRTGAVLTCYGLDLSELSIGLVTDVGQVDDGSFNESSWNGVLAVSRCGATVDFIETQDAADYATNIAEFAEQGVDIIVTVGFALGQATAEAAASYPDIRFIGVDQFQGVVTPGVTGLIFPEDQAGYLAGVLAARLNQTGTIAAVLGTDQVPPVVAFAEGYRLGALATNPDINVLLTYHPGGLDVAFTDPAWGAATARQALDQGADVVFAAGGKTGNGGLIEVAGAVSTPGSAPFCIGVDTDQWYTVPEAHSCLISSAMKLLDAGVATLILQFANGTIADGNFVGQVGLAPFHDLSGSVPAEVQSELEQLAIDLAAGEVATGYGS
ncbi:MAG: BMP family ABC transporter substrate-binding protein [Chloroflexi bacterium]|nr:BMP family ABC transporter substrate-binding protein [Chloroflexota bacterium]NOG64810.1 BMP family ABC transporter substrate-binding protein [Chloroflexota bacterium]